MELLILDPSLKSLAILDVFESVIWTDRYCKFGDFEIYTRVSDDILIMLQPDNLIYNADSDRLMIIEDTEIEFNIEDGDKLLVKGRSMESILDRRIIWDETILTGSFQNGIKKLMDENAISPTISDRQIPNLSFELSSDPYITALTIDTQFTRDNLYESIQKLCAPNDVGFKITLSSDSLSLVFKLYCGEDRSYAQIENPYVVFSKGFENLISSKYKDTRSTNKNLTIVCGEGEGLARITKVIGSFSGLSRKELYTDARDLSKTIDGVTLSDADYLAHLEQRGIEKLLELSLDTEFEGEVENTLMFKYREDFFMGDIVQLVSEYGISGRARIIEMIQTQNLNGTSIHPTFSIIY